MLEIKFYIPDTPAAPRIRLMEKLKKYAGGLTQWQGNGFWDDKTGKECAERVHVFLIYINSNHRNIMRRMAHEYREDAHQEEVLYSISEVEVYSIKEQ